MELERINVGQEPNDNTGDKLRDAFIKVNNASKTLELEAEKNDTKNKEQDDRLDNHDEEIKRIDAKDKEQDERLDKHDEAIIRIDTKDKEQDDRLNGLDKDVIRIDEKDKEQDLRLDNHDKDIEEVNELLSDHIGDFEEFKEFQNHRDNDQDIRLNEFKEEQALKNKEQDDRLDKNDAKNKEQDEHISRLGENIDANKLAQDEVNTELYGKIDKNKEKIDELDDDFVNHIIEYDKHITAQEIKDGEQDDKIKALEDAKTGVDGKTITLDSNNNVQLGVATTNIRRIKDNKELIFENERSGHAMQLGSFFRANSTGNKSFISVQDNEANVRGTNSNGEQEYLTVGSQGVQNSLREDGKNYFGKTATIPFVKEYVKDNGGGGASKVDNKTIYINANDEIQLGFEYEVKSNSLDIERLKIDGSYGYTEINASTVYLTGKNKSNPSNYFISSNGFSFENLKGSKGEIKENSISLTYNKETLKYTTEGIELTESNGIKTHIYYPKTRDSGYLVSSVSGVKPDKNGNVNATVIGLTPSEDGTYIESVLIESGQDYKGAIATVPYVKRTVDGMAGKGLNSANGVLNVNTKQETANGLNFLDIYNIDGGFSLNSEHKFIAPIDGKERRSISNIYSDRDELVIKKEYYEDGSLSSRPSISIKNDVIMLSSNKDAIMNGYTLLNENNAKSLGQFGKSFKKINTSNGYVALDNTEEPKITLLGDVLYLNANLTNPNGVSQGIPIQNFNQFNFRPARTLYFTVPIDNGTAVIKITKNSVLTIESVSNTTSKNIYINVSFLNKEIV